jgi:hypothetical protein
MISRGKGKLVDGRGRLQALSVHRRLQRIRDRPDAPGGRPT